MPEALTKVGAFFTGAGMREHRIDEILEDSIAKELGIKKGDTLISVNGKSITDIFDYSMEMCSEHVEICVLSGNETVIYEIEKDPDEDVGLVFEQQLMDKPKRCGNKCMFCFIDQLPPDMRETLHFKDDDVRLSFLYGNYVTLTNTGDEELNRLIRHRLSPVNISVHSTDPELRVRMLGNRKAGNIMDIIKKLINERIEVNAQFVIVPGVNDREALTRSLNDMSDAGRINSISVVPVGITRFRHRLPKIEPVSREMAAGLIAQTDRHREDFFHKYGKSTVYAADELYITAGIGIPPDVYYEGYPQIENGVGMVRIFVDEFNNAALKYKGMRLKEHFSIITGENFHEHLVGLINSLDNDDRIRIHRIRNDFFGNTVGTAGLLTYTDIVRQLENQAVEDNVMLPSVMFRNSDMLTLDGYSADDFSGVLNRKITVVQNDAEDLLRALFNV